MSRDEAETTRAVAGGKQRVVIIGGGFGGLEAARALARADVTVTVIDRRNFHLFQPLLYQVATGGLNPGDIASPIRELLKRQDNAEVLLGDVIDIDVARRLVRLADEDLRYDWLIVAVGSRNDYFGHDEWAPLAPGLKTIEDATEIRARILGAFERAERVADAEERRDLLRFVIVGAGPTGMELAGAIAEIARDTLRSNFRRFEPEQAEILLVEAADRLLPGYPAELSEKAAHSLARLGVRLRTRCRVTAMDADGVSVLVDGHGESLRAATVLWTAGVSASPLAASLAEQTGARLGRGRTIVVEPDLTLAGHPEISVVGDAACFVQDGNQLPLLAPVAKAQGRHAARAILLGMAGQASPPFRYRDRGSMATIGRSAAVADIRGWHLSGFVAWLAWLFIHLIFLIEFENRVLVLVQWAWSYLTHNRSARLITDPHSVREMRERETQAVAEKRAGAPGGG